MPVFFITSGQIVNGTVTITGPLLDHLRDSLRVKLGERIRIVDEHRRRYDVEVTDIHKRMLHGCVVGQQTGPVPHSPRLVLGQAMLKGERMDWAIQKSVELGVSTIVPLVSEQTIVRPRQGRAGTQQERWQRIALEAAQQSERWDIPSVDAPLTAPEFFGRPGPASLKLILSERESGETLQTMALPSKPTDTIILAVGPEGGWRGEELSRARAGGFRPVTLGARILRAETAALAAVSVIQGRLGELG